MKKAIIVKDYNSVWGVQNRVEALVDWSMNRDHVPFDIDINGDNALITLDDSKKIGYESDFTYNSDMQLFNNILRDINDPLFKEDVSITVYDDNSATPDTTEMFKQTALESCSSLGIDILRGYGLDLPEIAEKVEPTQPSLSRAQEAAALADKLDQEIGTEALDFTVDHIPQYNSETDTLEGEEPLERPTEIHEEEDDDEEIVTPAEAVEVASEQPEEEEEEPSETETVTPESKPAIIKVVDPNVEFVKELKAAIEKYELTPESFVACLMSIKALANKAAKAPTDVTPDDVTGSEDYSYTNAVPYVQNPNAKQDPDVETQGANVADGKPNTEIGTESIFDSRILRVFTGKGNKAIGEIDNKEVEDIIKTLDKRVKIMLPRFDYAVKQLYREMPGLDKDYPDMFKVDYKLVRLGNKVQFRIIEVDTTDRNKHNAIVFVIGLLLAGVLGAAVGAMDPTLAVPAGLGAGIGAANSMTTTHELEMNLATGAILDEPLMARLNAVTKDYKTGLISDYFGLEIDFFTPVKIGNEAMSADDVYSSLINEPVAAIPELDIPFTEEFTNVGLEALWAKHPKRKKSDNQVLEDMKKICEDAKAIAKKALQELKDKNAEIFEKYGAFVKILLDIKDIIFMDKHYVKLEVAKFELAKANKEVVPDTPNESVINTLAGVAVNGITNAVLGPFASLATPKQDSPSNYLLAVANQLREAMNSKLKRDISEYQGTITLVEDELKGNMVLTLAFKPLEPATESIQDEPEELPLIQQLAMESSSDDEFFNKVMSNFDNLDRNEVKETTKYNMWHFYRTGEKIPCDGALSGMRLCEFIKK